MAIYQLGDQVPVIPASCYIAEEASWPMLKRKIAGKKAWQTRLQKSSRTNGNGHSLSPASR